MKRSDFLTRAGLGLASIPFIGALASQPVEDDGLLNFLERSNFGEGIDGSFIPGVGAFLDGGWFIHI